MSYLGKVDMNDANVSRYYNSGIPGAPSSATEVVFADLGWTPTSANTLRITINGVVQQNAAITSTGVTWGGAVIATDELEIIGIESVGNIITTADNSVSTAKLADDSVTLAKMAGGTDGNLITYDASGDPAHVATGTATHVLTSNGAGAAPTFQAAPAGGLTAASQWRLHTDVASGGQDPINANLEVADQDGYGSLGSAMTESAGVFTFPSTGFWLVIYNWSFKPSNYSNDCSCWIDATINNGTDWVEQSRTWTAGAVAIEVAKMSASATAIIDVTDVANVKVQFGWSINLNGGTRITYGDSDRMETGFTFLRLADT